MYRSPNLEKRHNRRGSGPRCYFLREDLVPVYSSGEGACWQVLARSLEEAVSKVAKGDVVRSW